LRGDGVAVFDHHHHLPHHRLRHLRHYVLDGEDDDEGSIGTVVPHELESVEEEDQDQLAAAAATGDDDEEEEGGE